MSMSDKVFAIIKGADICNDEPLIKVGVYTRDDFTGMNSLTHLVTTFHFSFEGAQRFLHACVELGKGNEATEILRETGYPDVAIIPATDQEKNIAREYQSRIAPWLRPIPMTHKCHVCGKEHLNVANIDVVEHAINLPHCSGYRNVHYCTDNDECFKAACDKKWGKIFNE